MNIQILQVPKEYKDILYNLLQLYLYDFSEFEGRDLDEYGHYRYSMFDLYWVEENRVPYAIAVDGVLAGLVLVCRYNYFTGHPDRWIISEFFVMRKYRRKGVGEWVAKQIFDRYSGEWQVAQINANTGAIAFWRKVIDRYTSGNYQEELRDDERWRGPVQVFSSTGPDEQAE